jgi:hypothetical protein
MEGIVGVQVAIDVNQRLVVSTFSGEIHDAEFLQVSSLIRSHPDFDPNFSEILDFSGVTAGALSTRVIQELAQGKSIYSPTSMHLVIAPQDHLYGLGRMAQVFAQQTKPNVMVVRTIDEARKFLGLETTG